MAKQRIIDLPETKGEFKLRGFIKGTFNDNFYKASISKKGTEYRSMKFGVQVDEESTIYLDLYESKPREVFFYKKGENGAKGVTERIPYANRSTFNKAGFSAIGMSNFIELELDANGQPAVDEKGKAKNKNVTLNNYDSVEYLSKNLTEEKAVFVIGKPSFSSYKVEKNGETEIRRNTRFVPDRVMNSTSVDFEAEDFKATADFRQTFVFTGITLDTSDKNDEKGIVQGLVVNYSTIEEVEFVLRNKKLFKSLKTRVKPYTAMTIFGSINNRVLGEDVVEDDDWGVVDPFKKVSKTYIREMEILGVDPSTFDTDTYSRKEIEKALESIANQQKTNQEFGESTTIVSDEDDWGSADDSWD